MCDPIGGFLIASTAMSVGGQAASFVGQSQQAQSDAQFQNRRYTETANAAVENYTRNIGYASRMVQQESEAAAQEGETIAAAGQRSAGTVATSAAAGGVSGAVVDELFQDYARQEAAAKYANEQNLKNRRRQIGEDLKGVRAGTQSAISSATPSPVRMPSLLATALSIGGSIAEGGARIQSLR